MGRAREDAGCGGCLRPFIDIGGVKILAARIHKGINHPLGEFQVDGAGSLDSGQSHHAESQSVVTVVNRRNKEQPKTKIVGMK